jgi:antitoxin CptB
MVDRGRLKKLKWLCRRGMKELDILLEQFLGKNETALNRGEWSELEPLLSIEDDVLWDWIQDPDCAAAAPFRHLLTQIRRDSASSH